MSRKIVIAVDRRGDTNFDAQGFVGDECVGKTKSFEEALQGVEVGRREKPEFYDTPASTGEAVEEQSW